MWKPLSLYKKNLTMMKRDGDENLGDKHNPNDIIQASTSTPF